MSERKWTVPSLPLAVKVLELLDEVEILEEDGSIWASGDGVLVVSYGNASGAGQMGLFLLLRHSSFHALQGGELREITKNVKEKKNVKGRSSGVHRPRGFRGFGEVFGCGIFEKKKKKKKKKK